MPYHEGCFGNFKIIEGNWAATPQYICEKCGEEVEPGCEGFDEEVVLFNDEKED
jgi:hypothetical protein